MNDPSLSEEPRDKPDKTSLPLSREKTPEHKDRIDNLIEKQKQLKEEMKPKPKPDLTYLHNLQSQVAKNNNKLGDLNHRYNILEQKFKASEEKNRNLIEANKQLKEESEKKDKELKNLNARNHYLLKEKQDLEDRVKELKHYINRLEQRILQNPALVKSSRIMSPAKFSPHKGSPSKDEPKEIRDTNVSRVEGYHQEEIEKLKQILENQKYEIKMLTQALEEKEALREYRNTDVPFRDRKLDSISEATREEEYSKGPEDSTNRRDVEKLAADYQALLRELNESKKTLKELKEENLRKEQETRRKDTEYKDLVKDKEKYRLMKEEIERERDSLYSHIDTLNEKLKKLNEENIKLQRQVSDLQLKLADEKNKVYSESSNKEAEIQTLKDSLLREKEKNNELNDKLNEEIERQLALLKEKENLKAVATVNSLLKNEVEQLKYLHKEYEKEIQYYREQTQTLQREKDALRAKLENFNAKSSSIEQHIKALDPRSFLQETGDTIHKVNEDVERLEIEKRKLKEALNQARNEIDAYKQKENELEQQIQKKEKQIDNLVNSRNMMQNTLAEQIFSLKKQNEQFKEEITNYSSELKALREENQSLRDLLRKHEKIITEQNFYSRKKI